MCTDRIRRRAPRGPRRRAVSVLPLVASALLTLAGCSPSDAPLAPVHRLSRVLEPSLEQIPLECDVDDVFRPTIGCIPTVPLPVVKMPLPADRVLTVPVQLPDGIKPGLVVFEPRVRGHREQWRRTARMLVARPPGGRTELTVALPDEVKGDRVDVQVNVRPVPPSHQERATRPLPIGRGAVLSVALGLDPLGEPVGASGVEFRLVAETDRGRTDLLRAVLDPDRDRGWQEHTVDLARFVGERVRFRLVSEAVPRAGALGSETFAFPLWGSAQVLEPRGRDGRRNVVLISLDTLRGDQLGGTLDGLPLMPELEARAVGGALFENAYTTYPSTTAGHMSMLTGLYVAAHGTVSATEQLSANITTLPEIFARNGYVTAAVTEDAMLSAYVGFVRGFDDYREVKGKSMWDTAGEIEHTFGAGLDWIERHADERFFLFLHTYQVHTPYNPPPAYDLFKHWEKDGQRVPIDANTPAPIRDRHLYAGEVRYTDAVLDRLIERLGELDLLDDTIVVVTADHGEEFAEHGSTGHGTTVFDEVLHVPLVILAPRLVPAGRRIDVPVSLVDLVPTLLDLTHIRVPPGLHGRSLVPLLHGEPSPATRVIYAEAPPWGPHSGHRTAARTAGFKWIASDDPQYGVQVFDLTTDPDETTPLGDPRLVATGRSFERAYRAIESSRRQRAAKETSPASAAKRPELDDATIEKLKALGYMD